MKSTSRIPQQSTERNIYEHLHNEHEQIAALFEELTASRTVADDARRRQLFGDLKRLLQTHTHAEERVFYAVLKGNAQLREMIEEAVDEHDEAEGLLEQLSTVGTAGDEWLDLMAELQEAVEHHIAEEEGEVFERARQLLTDEQAMDLGRRMRAEEDELRSAA